MTIIGAPLGFRARVSFPDGRPDCATTKEPITLSIFRTLRKNERGATAIEYVLIASLILVAAITAMTTVGGKVSNVLSNVANAMN